MSVRGWTGTVNRYSYNSTGLEGELSEDKDIRLPNHHQQAGI